MNTSIEPARYKSLRRYIQFKRASLLVADVTIDAVLYGGVAVFFAWAVCRELFR
jgi:hypothetical protein